MSAMVIKKKPCNIWQSISTMLVIGVAILSTYPQAKTIPYYKITSFVSLVLWCFGTFLVKPDFFIKMPVQRAVSVFFVVYTVGMAYLFGNWTIGNRFVEFAQIPFFYWVYQYNTKYGNVNSNLTIIKWTLPFVVIACIKTGMGLLESPYLSRRIKSGGEDTMLLWQQGIGGYDFIYFITILSVILLYIVLSTRKLNTVLWNLLLISELCLFLLVIICSNYFTALVMVLVSVLLMLILKKRSMLSKVILSLSAIVCLIFSEQIVLIGLNVAVTIFSEGRTLDRLMTIQSSILLGQGGLEEISDRSETIQSSIQAFLDSPIMGLVSTPLSFEGEYLSGFGQHSQFVDTFALYGLLGVLQIYFILQPFTVRLREKLVLKNFSIVVMIATIILFTFNNVTPSVGLAIFLFFPVAYDWVKEKHN